MGLRNKQRNLQVGLMIKHYREKNNLTQKELAEKIDKSESTVRMWELGKSEPDLETLILLANIFDIEINELFALDNAILPQGNFVSSDKKAITIRLKELRKQANKTQAEIAQMLEVSFQAYSNWENGNRQADYDTLIKLADYFNVSVDYLLGHDVKSSNSVINRPDYEIDFLEKFGSLLNIKEFLELAEKCKAMTKVQIGIVFGFASLVLEKNL